MVYIVDYLGTYKYFAYPHWRAQATSRVLRYLDTLSQISSSFHKHTYDCSCPAVCPSPILQELTFDEPTESLPKQNRNLLLNIPSLPDLKTLCYLIKSRSALAPFPTQLQLIV